MQVQEVVQRIENAGCSLWLSGNTLKFSSTEKLTLGQLEFLKKRKREICDYLQSANDGKYIERPDNETPFIAKKALLYQWLCRKMGIEPDNWELLNTDKQLEIQSATNVIYHSLVHEQCQKCGHFGGKWECTNMNGFQIVCEEWDPRLVDWRSCPLSTETSEERDERLGQ